MVIIDIQDDHIIALLVLYKHIITSGHLRLDYLIKYAYFDKVLFRTVCFYQ